MTREEGEEEGEKEEEGYRSPESNPIP